MGQLHTAGALVIGSRALASDRFELAFHDQGDDQCHHETKNARSNYIGLDGLKRVCLRICCGEHRNCAKKDYQKK